MDTVLDAVNETGFFLMTSLEPLPVDAVMCVFLALACFVWFENMRAFARKSRQQRRAREATRVEFEGETDEDVCKQD